MMRSMLGLAFVAALASAGAAHAQAPVDADCLSCHDDAAATRADGTSVAVAPAKLAASVHGEVGLSCVDCHQALATAELPHAEEVAPVDCAACHTDAVAKYRAGAHAAARRKDPKSAAASCGDCHGHPHEMRPKADPVSPTNHLKVADTCARCHANEGLMAAAEVKQPKAAVEFHDSIHGRALREKGLVVAPNCATCHGAHDMRPGADPLSRVARANVGATCGECHQGILTTYQASVHGKASAAGNPLAAICSDCHSAHRIKATDVPQWQLSVQEECGTCHVESMRTYRDGFHGQASKLGFTRVAACKDCHGSHDILPREDPKSRIADANRAQTCARCHEGATASFAKYDPHADPHDRERNPMLSYTAQFMKWLLAGVFTFFGIHTGLWIPRSWQARRNAARKNREGEDTHGD
jgi:nitrate/TMAO reductase-like tetraheme cytochrome c subunit